MRLYKILLLAYGVMLPLTSLRAQNATYTNRQGMEFVLIQPGTMVVGRFQPPYPNPPQSSTINKSNEGLHWTTDEYALAQHLVQQDTRPGFPVHISRPFYIGKFEVTQAQWKQVMGHNPATFQGALVSDGADQHPVEQVTWQDTQAFLAKLNALDKTHHYRLPTEFEWEYAARAGAQDDIAWKAIWASAQMGSTTTSRVGQKTPNAWGLYDMLGNVWEWVQDYYNEKPFADPVPPRSGKQHVLKGASFVGDVKNATYMTHAAGPANGWDVGFRVVMEEKQAPISQIPAGFTPIFNGKNLDGWHTSRTSHQGTTGNFHVENGEITLQQHPYGQGGILLTNKKYHNFELYLEARIDSFCNGGIFIRSTESGMAYQIELATPGGLGNLLGERMQVSQEAQATNIARVWKAGPRATDRWNAFRIRMEGDVPRIRLWVNNELMWDVTEPKNDFVAGATSGMIGLQSHWSAVYSAAADAFNMAGSWKPGAAHRFRNIAIKEL